MIAAAFTRWSTKYSVLALLLRSKETLQQHYLDHFAAWKRQQYILIDCNFWNELEDVKMIFKPLNKVQHQSKSDDTHIGYFISRWIKIEVELKRLYDIGKFLQLASVLSIKEQLLPQFERQTYAICWAAYCLDPKDTVFHWEPKGQMRVTNFLKPYIGQNTEAEWAEIFQHFHDFQKYKRFFNPTTNL